MLTPEEQEKWKNRREVSFEKMMHFFLKQLNANGSDLDYLEGHIENILIAIEAATSRKLYSLSRRALNQLAYTVQTTGLKNNEFKILTEQNLSEKNQLSDFSFGRLSEMERQLKHITDLLKGFDPLDLLNKDTSEEEEFHDLLGLYIELAKLETDLGNKEESNIYTDTGLSILEDFHKIYRSMLSTNLEGRFLYTKAEYHRYLGEIDVANSYTVKAMHVFTEVGFKEGIIRCKYQIAKYKSMHGEYEESLQLLLDIKENDLINDSELKIEIFIEIGNINFQQQRYREALIDFENAFYIADTRGYAVNKGISLYRIANTLNKLNQKQDKVMGYYLEALEIFEAIGYLDGQSTVFHCIGAFYKSLGNRDQAKLYFLKSLEVSEELLFPQGIADTQVSLALMYAEENSLDKALDLAKKSYEIFLKQGSRKGIIYSYELLGGIYLKLKDWDLAFDYLEKSVSLAADLKILSVQINSCLGLVTVLENLVTNTYSVRLYMAQTLDDERLLDYKEERYFHLYNFFIERLLSLKDSWALRDPPLYNILLEIHSNLVKDFNSTPPTEYLSRIASLRVFSDFYIANNNLSLAKKLLLECVACSIYYRQKALTLSFLEKVNSLGE